MNIAKMSLKMDHASQNLRCFQNCNQKFYIIQWFFNLFYKRERGIKNMYLPHYLSTSSFYLSTWFHQFDQTFELLQICCNQQNECYLNFLSQHNHLVANFLYCAGIYMCMYVYIYILYIYTYIYILDLISLSSMTAQPQRGKICECSVQFSLSVMSDPLRPHESQHARPPCPSPTPGVYSNSCPSSQ